MFCIVRMSEFSLQVRPESFKRTHSRGPRNVEDLKTKKSCKGGLGF